MRSVILLHGAIGASDQLISLQDVLKDKGFTVFTLDFSGHGGLPFDDNGFGIPAFAEELRNFITTNKIEKPNIFGYSMGGYVALYLASGSADLIGNIATLGTKFNWTPEISAKEIKMLDVVTLKEKVPKFAEALNKRHGSQWEKLLNKTAQMMIEMGSDNPLKPSHFNGIQNKVLLGWAEGDTMVTKEETETVLGQLRNAKMFVLQNAKHPIESVNVNELAKILIPHYK